MATALVVSVIGWRAVESLRDDSPVNLAAYPAPPSGTAPACARFAAALPDRLGSLKRRDVVPERPGFVAYGDPAVEVRCGVPASERYRPGDQLISVNDVAWYADESRPGGVDFSLPRHVLNISVWIPDDYKAELLSPLTDAVTRAQPL